MATAEAGDLRATLGDQAQRAGMSSAQVLVELTRMRRALVGKTEKCDELARWAEILSSLITRQGSMAGQPLHVRWLPGHAKRPPLAAGVVQPQNHTALLGWTTPAASRGGSA